MDMDMDTDVDTDMYMDMGMDMGMGMGMDMDTEMVWAWQMTWTRAWTWDPRWRLPSSNSQKKRGRKRQSQEANAIRRTIDSSRGTFILSKYAMGPAVMGCAAVCFRAAVSSLEC